MRPQLRLTSLAAEGARCTRVAAAAALLVSSGCRLLEPHSAPRNRVLWETAIVAPAREMSAWSGVPGSDGHYAYFQTDTGVIAIDPANGHPRWAIGLWRARTPVSEWILHRNGMLFLADRDAVYALDAATGALRWRQSFGADSAHQLVILGADDANVYVTQAFAPVVSAARQADGALLWQRQVIPDSGYSAVVIGMGQSGDTLYFSGARNRASNGYPKTSVLTGVSRGSGDVLLQFEKERPNTGASKNVVVHDSLLVLSDFLQSSVLAVNRFTGRRVWEYQGDDSYFGPGYAPQLLGDTAFVASNDRNVYALNRSTGALIWKRQTHSSVSSFALCGRFIVTNNMAIGLVDRTTHTVEGYYVAPNGDEHGFTTSGFAVFGNIAVVSGSTSIYGIDCS